MAALRTYRHIVAAFLVAVYAFIAAPVQLWHHHKYVSATKQGIISFDTSSGALSQSSDSSSEANCRICSHKYSTYSDDALIPFESSVIVIAAKNGCYSLQLIAVSSFSLPNKGPPALS